MDRGMNRWVKGYTNLQDGFHPQVDIEVDRK